MSFTGSFTFVVVDSASFKKTLEMARVKSFNCQLQSLKIGNCAALATNECKVLCSFNSIFGYGTDSSFVSRPFAIPMLKKRAQTFSWKP